MNERDLLTLGTAIAAIAGMLERKGVCTTRELADHFGGIAMVAKDHDMERAQDLAEIAHMLLAASMAHHEPPEPGMAN